MLLSVPPRVVSFAVDRLAEVDYTVANRVTEDVARLVHVVYDNDLPRPLVPLLLHALEAFDQLGSVLIAIVVWMADH